LNGFKRRDRTKRVTTAPDVLKRRISEGILAFPASPFTASGGLDAKGFAEHIDFLAAYHPSAIVPAGGAGELFSLSAKEQETLIRIAVERSLDSPVIAGIGQGIAIATETARLAERLGASGVLLFPPYLVTPEQEGLFAYIRQVCRSVSIGVIVYSRNNGVVAPDTALRLAEACPNLIAIKDGIGDFEALVSLKQRAGDRLCLINGVPTAEIIAPQCFAMGVRSYTSAVFSFLPLVASRYFRAVRDNDRAMVDRFLGEFYVPLSALRNRQRGYAVAIVKAGLRAVGRPAGSVRPPLVDLTADAERELAVLIARAGDLVEEAAPELPAAAKGMR
jgi:5-dehydro-4-deoxyglucarate dehydratase